MHCFDTPYDLVPKFKLVRQERKTEVPVQFMTAYYDEAKGSCELLVEFTEQIDDTDVEKCFYAHGAKGVNVLTFGNDRGRAAAIAYTRITDLQMQSGFKLSRGELPDSLEGRLKGPKKAQKDEKVELEFNEKIHVAEKISLDEFKSKMEDVHDQMQGLGQFQQGIKDDVLSVGQFQQGIKDDVHGLGQFQQGIKDDVQSYGVKMEAGFEGVKQEVLSFIPDFQERVKQLEKEVDYHKAQRDAQEYKTARQTAKVNQRDREIAVLQNKEEASIKREDGLRGRIKELENIVLISSTVEKLKEMTRMAQEDRAFASTELKEMTRMAQEDRAFTRAEREELRYSITDIQESAKTLEGLLSTEEERAFKRPRA